MKKTIFTKREGRLTDTNGSKFPYTPIFYCCPICEKEVLWGVNIPKNDAIVMQCNIHGTRHNCIHYIEDIAEFEKKNHNNFKKPFFGSENYIVLVLSPLEMMAKRVNASSNS